MTVISEFSTEWLESASVEELESEVDRLSSDIISIDTQLMPRSKWRAENGYAWVVKAKEAKRRKNLDRERLKRQIGKAKRRAKIERRKSAENHDRILIKHLRQIVGEDRFLEAVNAVDAIMDQLNKEKGDE